MESCLLGLHGTKWGPQVFSHGTGQEHSKVLYGDDLNQYLKERVPTGARLISRVELATLYHLSDQAPDTNSIL